MEQNIAVIGLGRCGLPVAERLLEAGHRVVGLDKLAEANGRLAELGGQVAPSPAQAAQEAATVIVLVLNEEQVREVVLGAQGVLEGAQAGATVIGMSTISRAGAAEVAAACREAGLGFVDCPFTGGPARAAEGSLTLIAAAAPDDLAAARPVLDLLGSITLAGKEPGMGQAMKHCNQLLVTAVHAATIELIALARASGLDPETVCQVVGSGIAGNDYFRLLAAPVLQGGSSPGGMGQLWKDVNLVVDAGRSHNLPLLVATAASQYFNLAMAQGRAGEDSARLMEVMESLLSAPESPA